VGKLAGKVAIVTGSSKGIGAAIAKHFGRAGATVVVNYLSSKTDADRVVDQIINEGGKAIAIGADMTKEVDIQRIFSETKIAFGRVDIVVNNAGIYEFRPIEDVTLDHFHRQFDLNVLGVLLCCKEAVKSFSCTGNGTIINIASIVSTIPFPNASVYSATKAAVDAVTKSLSKELGSRGIRVNSISPGLTETEGFHAAGLFGGTFQAQAITQTSLGRIGQPDDIARVAVFLASDDAAWITGEAVIVSGGYH
jgi:3-oxoacyl-[acyl-carrier protein] reductase